MSPLAVLLVAIACAAPFYVVQPIIFTNDSVGYVEGAEALVRVPGGRYSYWRTPLFPALMAVTGVAHHLTLRGLVGIQMVLGLAMPLLVYFSLSRLSRSLAAATGIVVSLSLTSFSNAGYVMPQQLYYFMVVLSLFFTFRYLVGGSPSDIYGIALAGLAAVMVRPQASYLFLFLMLVALIAEPRQWKRCAIATAIAVALQVAYMAARPFFVSAIAPSNVVLLANLDRSASMPPDREIYRRGMLFVRDNLIDDGRTIAKFISDERLAAEVRLAAYLQPLLTNNPVRAESDAKEELDTEVRDQAYSFIALDHAARGDMVAAQRVLAAIKAPDLGRRTAAKFGKAFTVPVLTGAAPVGGRIAPRHYVNGFDLTDTGGKMMLFPVLLARMSHPGALIVPENGPATAQLYFLLDRYLQGPRVLEVLYPNVGRFISDQSLGIRPLLTDFGSSAAEAHWTVWQMLERLIGPTATNGLLGKVVFEFAKRHPWELADVYLRFVVQAIVGRAMVEGSTNVLFLPSHPDITQVATFQREIAASKRFVNAYQQVDRVFSKVWPNIGLTLAILAMCGILTIRDRRVFLIWSTCWIVVLHQIAVCALTAGTAYLYTSIIFIPLLVAACLTIFEAKHRIRSVRGASLEGSGHKEVQCNASKSAVNLAYW